MGLAPGAYTRPEHSDSTTRSIDSIAFIARSLHAIVEARSSVGEAGHTVAIGADASSGHTVREAGTANGLTDQCVILRGSRHQSRPGAILLDQYDLVCC